MYVIKRWVLKSKTDSNSNYLKKIKFQFDRNILFNSELKFVVTIIQLIVPYLIQKKPISN